jgi:endonuclease-3
VKKNKNISLVLKKIREMIGNTTPVVLNPDPFKVLISTVLSARTRDENTARASKQLFERFSNPKEIASAKVSELEQLIKPSGFYKVKARRIKKISQQLVKEFNGKVPSTLKELLELKGVGRKTANCVLVYAFKKPAIPVDVHVHRVSNRIGLVKTFSTEETEIALSKIVPKNKWIELNELMVKFGQRVCKPLKPLCEKCLLQKECNYFSQTQGKG